MTEVISPYRGIQTYTEEERAFFFGREREQVLLTANLRTSPLTVLYGGPGVGKSSLLQAGLAPALREREEAAVVVFRQWQHPGAVTNLRECVIQEARRTGAELDPGSGTFPDLLAAAAQATGRTVYLILDQFEEYFLYHHEDLGNPGFDAELANAINGEEFDAHFLFVLLEESLSKLDRLGPRIPNILGNLIRLEHLNRVAAARAITGPLDEYNRRLAGRRSPVELEGELVDAVLDQIQSGSVTQELSGQGRGVAGMAGNAAAWFEAPFLQLVMSRIWEESGGPDAEALRWATLMDLGGAESIVRSHLDEIMARLDPREREIAAEIFQFLVTPSGTKIAQDAGALAAWAGVDEADVVEILRRLSAGHHRLLRRVEAGGTTPRYEVFHDVLAPAMLEWRTRYVHEQQRLASSRELASTARAQLPAHPELSVLLAVEAARIAPTVYAERTLRLALVESRVRTVCVGHTEPVVSVAFNADASMLLTASSDGSARLWATDTGAERAVFRGDDPLSFADLSPDDRLIVTAGAEGLVIWDVTMLGSVRAIATDAPLNSARFNEDGSLIAAGDVRGNLHVIETGTGRVVHDIRAHENAVIDARFSPPGSLIVTASADETARIWHTETGRLVRELRGHTSDVWSAAFGDSGSVVLTASFDSTVYQWDANSGRRTATWLGHTESVRSAEYSPDGRRVVTASYDGTARVWDRRTGRTAIHLYGHAGRVASAVFSRDGRKVATASADRTARIWDVHEERSTARIEGHGGGVNSVAFSPDGRFLMTASADETAVVWDWRADPPARRRGLRGHTDDLWFAMFSPDGTNAVTASFDGTARIFEANSGVTLLIIAGHEDRLTHAEYDPAGGRVVTASLDGTARIWSAATGELIHTLAGHENYVYSASFSPDGMHVVTSSWDETARIWNASTGDVVAVLRGHTDWVGHAAYSPDGRYVVTSSWDRTALVWDVATTRVMATLRGHAGRVRSAAFSPDGTALVTASGDETAFVWSVPDWAIIDHLRGHLGPVNHATWSPDSRFIATASHDGTARVYVRDPGGTVEELLERARTRVFRSLTQAERERYLPATAAW